MVNWLTVEENRKDDDADDGDSNNKESVFYNKMKIWVSCFES